jgi:hypothetical protein
MDTYKLWITRLEKEKKAHEVFRRQAEEAEKASRDDGDERNSFNILWSNNLIVRSAIYASTPKPDIRRRFQKPNPEEKELARMVERAISYNIDSNDFESPSNAAVKDYVDVGLGVPRAFMDVQTEVVGEDEEGEPLEQIVSQTVGIEHIPWRHFHWEPGKPWNAVDWVAFESWLPRKEVEKEYGVKIDSGSDEHMNRREADKYTEEVQVYEIWDKKNRKVIILAPTHEKVLEERDDTLGLQGFYPIPRPMFLNLKSDELIPKPDYEFVRPQVMELNGITKRIKSLGAQIKAVGYYDAANKSLGSLMASPDGTYKPVDNLNASTEHNPDKAMVHVPMQEKIIVLRELEMQRESVKNQIYEVTGISDIIRGSSKASETAAAQSLKGQWATRRLAEKTGEVARTFRDIFRIWAEIICEHFSPEILTLQTGVEITENMVRMMKSDIGRSFAIDVETDSTIAQDDYENRQQTMEMVEVILAKMEQVIPAVQAGALPVEFVQEVLLMVVNTHKHGKQLEDAIMELGPHLQGMIQFQEQMQQLQQVLAQKDAQLQQAGEGIQQREQALQGMQKQLGAVNQREEQRKDMELKIKDRESQVKYRKAFVETEAQQIENQIVRQKHQLDVQETSADVDKTRAETGKIVKETALMGIV